MFSSIVFNTSVPDVLPKGECIKHCMAKENADVTDHYLLLFHVSIYKPFIVLRLQVFFQLSLTIESLLGRNRSQSTEACGMMAEWYDRHFD